MIGVFLMEKEIQIIKIINEFSVVINAGSNYQIRDGQHLEVFVRGTPVIDPDTGDDLGTLDYVKAKLRVVNVFPKMSVCENRETELNSLMSIAAALQSTEVFPLNIDSTEISGGFEGIDKKIHVGDLVRTVN